MPEKISPVKPDFETVYEQYYDRIYRYVCTILLSREEAEDVVAETFLSAYAAWPGFDPERASPVTWLTRIAHNRAVNAVNSAASRREKQFDEPMEDSAAPDDFTEGVESADIVLRLYAKLTPPEREFLNLRYVLDLRDGEIADLMGLPVKTVNKRYQRLLARCRDILDRS